MMFDFLLQLPVVQGVPADSVVREKITEKIQTLASMDAHDLWNTLLHDALDAGKKNPAGRHRVSRLPLGHKMAAEVSGQDI
ncbi:MAG: hypothetical protein L6V35_02320 [Alistipes putredinis]|nr:MAG: hypothetical protein L6V35_02320 [Alistipes putredinis]